MARFPCSIRRSRPTNSKQAAVPTRGLMQSRKPTSQNLAAQTEGGLGHLIRSFDVLVVGGGNAALCAAISARRAGASVLVLEAAPKFYRGGNTRHTRNMRCAHDTATEILTGPYTEDEFWDDLLRVTGGNTDEQLGVEVEYDAEVVDLEIEGGTFHSATVARGPERVTMRASALVAAAGG